MVNTQEYLDQQCPKEIRGKISGLEINDKNLEGHLDLSEFVNLKKLNCSENKLTSINLSNNERIEFVDCSDNLLTDIDLSHQNPENLQGIIIQNNNLSPRDLSIFSRFVRLENLFVGNDDEEKSEQNIYNRFHGSLEYLKGLKRLVRLDINGTDINSGLEHLPTQFLEKFCCAARRNGAGVEKIKNTLRLSEEKAESEEKKDNKEKIRKIRAYKLFCVHRQQSIQFARTVNQYQMAIRKIKSKLDQGDLYFLLACQENALCVVKLSPHFSQEIGDRLRHIKQGLIEDFEALTKGEIDKVCQAQTEFIEARISLNQSRRQWQEMEALVQVYTELHR
ncbi:hypothetical protein [endosymbiont GvMRE of Glomus versiforme]|uniref:hypothetical protein n=1 Tax=endosymbiont GvMRE of Glomus versiforme TaxID=2039283 RepID=UPI000ECFF684|nr:hypothetical protein [endosymbiont GvMRE of Glomus versiforme]RHZ35216.1 Cdc15p [endosymbiont GvMRE of Glomus versiforme]